MKNYYSVWLANENGCLFDNANGFETIDEAKKWAKSHGGDFHVFIENEITNETVADYFLHVHGKKLWATLPLH